MAAGVTWYVIAGMIMYTALFMFRKDEKSHDVRVALAPPVAMQFVVWAPVILLLVLPWPLPMWSERRSVLRILGECLVCVVGWPLFGRVDFYHIVVTDALTSLTLWLYELEFTVCHFATTPWNNNTVVGNDGMITKEQCGSGTFNGEYVKPALYALPFWLRLVQCLFLFVQVHRRGGTGWARSQHLVNAGKYLSALFVVVSSALLPNGNNGVHNAYAVAWVVCLFVKTLYCFAWDLKMDWGLLQPRARYLFLRDVLHYAPYVYYAAILFNLFGRVTWSLAISPHYCDASCSLLLGIVEVVRRSIWLVFRAEQQKLKLALAQSASAASLTQPLLPDGEGKAALSINVPDAHRP